jgi:hypothetical protein
MTDCNHRAKGQIGKMVGVLAVFVLGVANFVMHKAVLESHHPLLARMPWFGLLGGRVSLAAEFLILLGAMLLVAAGFAGWGWAYLGYSALNAVAAWLILTRRV